MNPNQIPMPEESLDEIEFESTSSVDDFIKELEAKEKDLHITADLTIEIEESDYEISSIPDFVQAELPPVVQNGAKPSPAPSEPGMKTRVFELQNEVEALKAKITELRAERNEIQDKSDRRLKDFENYKYRMDRERRGSFIDQITNLASQMLPVLDNLERALDSVGKMSAEKSAEFQQFYDGIALVNQQVNEIFNEMGVQPIETVGETFDPNFHEAVAVEERSDTAGNTILEEMLRGYRIGNRVIRHSMVKVTSAPSRKPEKPAEMADEALEISTPPQNDPPETSISEAE